MEVEFENNMCVELFSNLRSYGRIILRENFSTIAVGMIKEIKWDRRV